MIIELEKNKAITPAMQSNVPLIRDMVMMLLCMLGQPAVLPRFRVVTGMLWISHSPQLWSYGGRCGIQPGLVVICLKWRMVKTGLMSGIEVL
jgi:hypothetical protein